MNEITEAAVKEFQQIGPFTLSMGDLSQKQPEVYLKCSHIFSEHGSIIFAEKRCKTMYDAMHSGAIVLPPDSIKQIRHVAEHVIKVVTQSGDITIYTT